MAMQFEKPSRSLRHVERSERAAFCCEYRHFELRHAFSCLVCFLFYDFLLVETRRPSVGFRKSKKPRAHVQQTQCVLFLLDVALNEARSETFKEKSILLKFFQIFKLD